ncbi:hypothetical protein HN51_070512 [Arachis hypogaea]
MERRTLMPHMATLLGFYRKNAPNQGEQQEQEVKFAGTVEVFFDQRDANTSMPSPLSLMENWRRAVVVWDAWRKKKHGDKEKFNGYETDGRGETLVKLEVTTKLVTVA